jgi:tripartite motif-containing protein 2/3/tripartite motif-containing protein 71
VPGGAVTRFLGGGLRGVVSRVIAMPGVVSYSNGVALSVDGCTLLVADSDGGSHAIHEFNVADGSRCRVIGGAGDGPLQFNGPRQVCVAPDGFVFVADCLNHRVQVLTPRLEFHGFIGAGLLDRPRGVCANADVVVASEYEAHRISVFKRCDGALLRRFGSYGSGDGQLDRPFGVCFLFLRHIAVADGYNNRVSVFSVDGDFMRHVGVGVLNRPTGVACSAFDELVVGDWGHDRVVLFSASGELVKTMGRGDFAGVAVHGGIIFAQDIEHRCVVFE